MKCNTEEGFVFDVGSLYAHFQGLHDRRKPKGVRYSLALVLVLMVLAKMCGEDRPSGIADWAKHRTELLAEWLKLIDKERQCGTTVNQISSIRSKVASISPQ